MTVYPFDNCQAELPSLRPTESYWLREVSEKLMGHCTTDELPSTADIVVIGSGITGAFAARELVKNGKNVLMLEAREACSGATGRNGGHCQPGIWDATPTIARFELSTFNIIKSLVETYSIPCDWHVVGGVHAIYSPVVLAAAKKQIQRLQQHPDLKCKAILIEDRKELEARHIPNAIAAVYQPNAAKLWPYKLVAWILEDLLQSFDAGRFNLQTNTPARSIQRLSGASTWSVNTSQGLVSANQVLLATNAYTPYLLPALNGIIVPVRGQVAALKPPVGAAKLEHTYVWTKGVDHQYLIQRGEEDTTVSTDEAPANSTSGQKILADRPLIFGGGRFANPKGEEGIYRDDCLSLSVSAALHKGIPEALKVSNDTKSDSQGGLQAMNEWTGIMGYSRDGGPWVGPVPSSLLGYDETSTEHASIGARPSSTGIFISAGYTGHGMPVATQCGIKVAQMMLGETRDKENGVHAPLPEEWLVSQDRVDRARDMEFPKTEEEMVKLMVGDA